MHNRSVITVKLPFRKWLIHHGCVCVWGGGGLLGGVVGVNSYDYTNFEYAQWPCIFTLLNK